MRPALPLFCALLCGAAHGAEEILPPHLVMPGTGIKAHYVHLHGESLVKPFGSRAQLVEQIHQCQALLTHSGAPIKKLGDGDIPQELAPTDTYIYSARDRSLAVTFTRAVGYSKIDCGLIETENQSSVITTPAGHCNINHRNKTAVGACDNNAVSIAPHQTRPPEAQSLGGKQIAGHHCDVFGVAAPIKAFTCLSRDGDFPAFPSKINPAFLPGLPLSVDTAFTKAEAIEVKMAMDVSPKLFAAPPGYKLISSPVGK